MIAPVAVISPLPDERSDEFRVADFQDLHGFCLFGGALLPVGCV
jgi:hypothetical protein